MMNEYLEDSLDLLKQESYDLWITSTVPTLEKPPTELEFHRDWVTPNRPCVIEGVIDQWPALKNWNQPGYLRDRIGDVEVSASVTPNGLADAIYKGKFVMPEERRMTFGAALDILQSPGDFNGVLYLQKQCSCFIDEYSALHDDAPDHIEWATGAFGKRPDAVNFWIGDQRAVTSMHKDQYENLYCVISGTKTFTLLPPIMRSYIEIDNFPVASYKENENGDFDVIDGDGEVPWVIEESVTPALRPLRVKVHAGQTLYLPSLWYHRVEQTQSCIAVNYWYDMSYDVKYCYFRFIESIAELKKKEDRKEETKEKRKREIKEEMMEERDMESKEEKNNDMEEVANKRGCSRREREGK